MKHFLPITACVLFFSAGIAQSQVVVRIGPPPRPVERIPPPPHEHPNWAWHSGYHRYDGHQYVWVPGYYANPPHAPRTLGRRPLGPPRQRLRLS
jgi:hypothetical protein